MGSYHYKLGDTIRIREAGAGIYDKFRYEVLDTPEKVEAVNIAMGSGKRFYDFDLKDEDIPDFIKGAH